MSSIFRHSVTHPIRVILIAVVALMLAGPGLLRLGLRTDGYALVPDDAPEVREDRAIREAFGIDDPIVVALHSKHADGIFNAGTFRRVAELTEALQQGLALDSHRLTSLATEKGDRYRADAPIYRRFTEPLPETPDELIQVRDDLRALEIYTGTLVSEDETATAILVGVPPGANRLELYDRIVEVVDTLRTDLEQIDVLGAPVAEALLGTRILEDLGLPTALLGRGASRDDPPVGGSHVADRLRRLVAGTIGLFPLALLVMALVLFLGFRSWPAVVIPLCEVGACLLVVFGLMGWLSVPIYLTTAVLPVILISIGVADEVHILSRYRQRLREREAASHAETVRSTMREMAPPVIATSVTTAVAFLSFATSPIGPVRMFGLFAASGIFVCMAWSLVVTPAFLVLIDPSRFVAPHAARPTSAFGRHAQWIARRRRALLATAAVLALVAPFGVVRIVVQDSWIDGFDRDGRFYRSTQRFNERFFGTHVLLVTVDAGHATWTGELREDQIDGNTVTLPAGAVDRASLLGGAWFRIQPTRPVELGLTARQRTWSAWIERADAEADRWVLTLSTHRGEPRASMRLAPGETLTYEIRAERMMVPAVLREIAALESLIEARREDAVGGVLGPAEYVTTSNFIAQKRADGSRALPETPERARTLWRHQARIRGQERVGQLVEPHFGRAIVTVLLKNANYADTARLMEAVRSYERERLAPRDIRISFAGDVAVSQVLIRSIVSTQTGSLLLSLVGILVVTSVIGGSLRVGIYSVLPCALAVLGIFAFMGGYGLPLGVATSMFAGIVLGVGVDYAIHLLARFRRSRAAGSDPETALAESLRVVGPAVLIDAAVVGCGFAVLTLSAVPANARLGGLAVLSIVGCLAASLVLLPALVGVWPLPPRRGLNRRGLFRGVRQS